MLLEPGVYPAQRSWPPFLAKVLPALPKCSVKMQMAMGRKALQKTGANSWDYVIRWFPIWQVRALGPVLATARAGRRQLPRPTVCPWEQLTGPRWGLSRH